MQTRLARESDAEYRRTPNPSAIGTCKFMPAAIPQPPRVRSSSTSVEQRPPVLSLVSPAGPPPMGQEPLVEPRVH